MTTTTPTKEEYLPLIRRLKSSDNFMGAFRAEIIEAIKRDEYLVAIDLLNHLHAALQYSDVQMSSKEALTIEREREEEQEEALSESRDTLEGFLECAKRLEAEDKGDKKNGYHSCD